MYKLINPNRDVEKNIMEKYPFVKGRVNKINNGGNKVPEYSCFVWRCTLW